MENLKAVGRRGGAVEEGGPCIMGKALEPGPCVCIFKMVHYSFSLSLCMAGHKSRFADGKAADGWLALVASGWSSCRRRSYVTVDGRGEAAEEGGPCMEPEGEGLESEPRIACKVKFNGSLRLL